MIIVVLLLVLLAWWFFGAVLALPIALEAARWGLLVGAAVGLAVTMFLLTGILGGERTSSPAAAVKISMPDDPRPAPLDFAWPSYLLLQCWYDIRENLRQVRRGIVVSWQTAWHLLPRITLPASSLRAVTGRPKVRSRWATVAVGWPLLTIPAAFLAGASVGAGAVALLVTATGAALAVLATFIALLVLGVLNLATRILRHVRRSVACCTHCYHLARVPVFACPGAHPVATESQRMHRRLRPGIQGLWWRRCGCGRLLPTTAARATRQLKPHCPRCLKPLYAHAGYASDLRIAVFGAPRAGKSNLLLAAVQAIAAAPSAQVAVVITEPDSVITLRFEKRRRPAVVHLFHPRGVDLLDPERRREMSYLDGASGLIYVLDPFSVPGLRTAIDHLPDRSFPDGTFATDDPTESYHAVVAALRFISVDTRTKRLAVVVTKRDLLSLVDDAAAAPSSPDVLAWIEKQGVDGISFSVENDFRQSRFFLVSARDQPGAQEPLRWLLSNEGIGVRSTEESS